MYDMVEGVTTHALDVWPGKDMTAWQVATHSCVLGQTSEGDNELQFGWRDPTDDGLME